MAGEIQLNSTTMVTESSGSITAELDTIRPNTTNGSLTLQGDSSDAGVTGLTIDSSGVVNTTTAKVTNIQATSGQSLTIKDEDGNAAITIGTDNTAASYLTLNFGSYHGDSGGAGSGSLSANILDDYEEGSVTITTATPETSGSITLNSGRNTLFYTKIGRSVTLSGMLQVTSFSSPVGNTVTLSPLPFTAASNVSGFEGRTGNAMPWRPSGTAGVPEYASGQIIEGGSTLVMHTDASTWSASNAQLVVNVTYVVA